MMDFGYFTLSDNRYPGNPRTAADIAPAFQGNHSALKLGAGGKTAAAGD